MFRIHPFVLLKLLACWKASVRLQNLRDCLQSPPMETSTHLNLQFRWPRVATDFEIEYLRYEHIATMCCSSTVVA